MYIPNFLGAGPASPMTQPQLWKEVVLPHPQQNISRPCPPPQNLVPSATASAEHRPAPNDVPVVKINFPPRSPRKYQSDISSATALNKIACLKRPEIQCGKLTFLHSSPSIKEERPVMHGHPEQKSLSTHYDHSGSRSTTPIQLPFAAADVR